MANYRNTENDVNKSGLFGAAGGEEGKSDEQIAYEAANPRASERKMVRKGIIEGPTEGYKFKYKKGKIVKDELGGWNLEVPKALKIGGHSESYSNERPEREKKDKDKSRKNRGQNLKYAIQDFFTRQNKQTAKYTGYGRSVKRKRTGKEGPIT